MKHPQFSETTAEDDRQFLIMLSDAVFSMKTRPLEQRLTVVPPDYAELSCAVCTDPIMTSPVWFGCSQDHSFCRECVTIRNEACPVCRERRTTNKPFRKAAYMERQIRQIKIKCLNPGCHWTGERDQEKSHLNECKHLVLRCNNGGCRMELPNDQQAVRDHQLLCKSRCPHGSPICMSCRMNSIMPGKNKKEKDHSGPAAPGSPTGEKKSFMPKLFSRQTM